LLWLYEPQRKPQPNNRTTRSTKIESAKKSGHYPAALLGQHPLPPDAALAIGKRLDLSAEQIVLLQSIPSRGSLQNAIPTDPTIYRFYEIVQVYGTTLKVLVHELFGDGIISAINFRLDIKKVEDPEGGSRAVITLDGKFLPTKPY
jgi:cyanate lyase